MKIKKNPHVNLEEKRMILVSIGFVIATSLTLMSLEVKQSVSDATNYSTSMEEVAQEEFIIQTYTQTAPPPPPPPPPVLTTQIVVLDDFVEIDDILDFNSQVEANDVVNFSDLSSDMPDETDDTEAPFIRVEKMPVYPNGGDAGLLRDLVKNTKYPMIAQYNRIQGIVYVGFVIDRDGSITDVKILRGVDPSLDKEAMRVIKALPNWIPGEQAGKPVRVSFQVPVTFRLQER